MSNFLAPPLSSRHQQHGVMSPENTPVKIISSHDEANLGAKGNRESCSFWEVKDSNMGSVGSSCHGDPSLADGYRFLFTGKPKERPVQQGASNRQRQLTNYNSKDLKVIWTPRVENNTIRDNFLKVPTMEASVLML